MKNKRGDIPTTILVIGVFAVCTLAMLSFFASNISLRNSFVGIDMVENINFEIERKSFSGEKVSELYLEKNVTKLLPWSEDELLFSVRYEGP